MKFLARFLCCLTTLCMHLSAEETPPQQKRILVTGGAGFLGSHLCERLLHQGHYVLCLDNFSTGLVENLKACLDNPRFQCIKHDITMPLDLDTPFDEIYNLACQASPPQYQKDPIHTLKTNVFGALFVLELAKKNKAKVFQASTSEVYGDPTQHPQKESYWGNVNPIGIRSCYDEGKRCAETLFFDYWRQHGVRIKVGRIFNTYGPRMRVDDGRVITNFITQALSNSPITIYGKGDQTRSFCYVEDLLDAICLLMDTSDDITGPINLGNPGEFTMLELAAHVISLTSSSSPLIFEELPQDDPKMRKPDLTLTQKTISWKPKISLEEGLKATIHSIKSL